MEILSKDGKHHKEMVTTIEGFMRIVLSLPSSKAEQFNQMIALVAADSSICTTESKVKSIERPRDMFYVTMADIIHQILNDKITNSSSAS